MKLIKPISAAAAALFLASCFGKREHAMEVEPDPAPVAAKPKPGSESRPDRPPPPPQPQDGSMIVKPGGTAPVEPTTPAVPKVSKEDQEDALAAAKREVAKRKANSGDSDDPISKALKDVDDDDINKAFDQLKKAADKYNSGD